MLLNKIFSKKNNLEDEKIVAMADGELIDITAVSDPIFAEKIMGESAAFKFYGDIVKICSPINGELTLMYPTGHAFGVTNKYGVEILVHIGVNTVEADGEGFVIGNYKQGDQLKCGDPIVTVNMEKLKTKYDMSTMLIITNSNGNHYEFLSPQEVKCGQSVLA